MKAIDVINAKELRDRTPLENAIMWMWLTDVDGDDSEAAANQLFDLLATVDAAERFINADGKNNVVAEKGIKNV